MSVKILLYVSKSLEAKSQVSVYTYIQGWVN